MSGEAEGIVAGILIMGAVGWFAEGVAVFLLVSMAGLVVIAILAAVALVAYCMVLYKAIAARKWDWVVDQFAAPLVGGVVGLAAYRLVVPFANHIGSLLQSPRHLTTTEHLLIGVAYVAFIGSALVAPILALVTIINHERPVRYAAYPLLALACTAWFVAELGHTTIFQ